MMWLVWLSAGIAVGVVIGVFLQRFAIRMAPCPTCQEDGPLVMLTHECYRCKREFELFEL